MKIFQGTGVSDGVAFGKLIFYNTDIQNIEKRTVSNIKAELERLEQAQRSTRTELQKTYEKALKIMSPQNADIFKAHVLLLDSPDFFESIVDIITTDKVCSEYAVLTVAQKLMQKLKNGNMKSPVNDIEDVSQCLLRNLRNEKFNQIITSEKAIICANELVPSQILEFNKSNVSGFCLLSNSHSSHIAIIAKAMKIPAVTGIRGLNAELSGKNAAIDGKKGLVYIDPDGSI